VSKRKQPVASKKRPSEKKVNFGGHEKIIINIFGAAICSRSLALLAIYRLALSLALLRNMKNYTNAVIN
jgi:hypothetical protein